MPGVDLLRARYVRHRFARHSHEGYTICAVDSGVEQFDVLGPLAGCDSGRCRAGPGQVVIINPEVVHTAQAGSPGGWEYRVLYPATDIVAEVAGELGHRCRVPFFPNSVVNDPESALVVRAVHDAAEQEASLAASTLLHVLIERLVRWHAGRRTQRSAQSARPAVVAAREVLDERFVAPPSLQGLAELVGMRPFPLLRAFRAETGFPPHAYVNQVRVRRTRELLEAGLRLSDIAARTGFADQAHMTRHFKRIIGVPPGAYRRARR
jgi:AraC-like DNA-binding protein